MSKFTKILKPNLFLLAALVAAVAACPSAASAQTLSTPTASPSGCLSGYPDGTYRGNRPVSRYEFAAGANACMNSVNQTIQFNRANYATKADLAGLIQRQRELNQQLRELNDRVAPPSEGQSGKTE